MVTTASYVDASLLALSRGHRVIGSHEGSRFWVQDDPILDAQGQVIRGGMWPSQRKWWNLDTFIKVLVGGYGSGKSWALAKRAMSLALTNSGCPGAVVSPTYGMARQTTLASLIALCQGKESIYGKKFWWRYNQGSHELTIRFHGRVGRILIYSGDNPLTLKGTNLAFCLIDEPFIQEEEVFSQMIARVRHPDAVHSEICLTGTPEQLNWGYEVARGEYSQSKKLSVGVVQVSTRENKALDPSYVERLEGSMSPRAARAYIEGDFVSLSDGLVYYAFDSRENIVDLGEIPQGAELGVGMDFNVDPMAAMVFWRRGEHLHFFEEIELPNADTEYMCSTLREKFGRRLQAIYPDASGAARHSASPGGKSDFWYIKQMGFEVYAKGTNPLRKDRYNAVNGKFKPRNGRLSLTISPKCFKLVKYLNSYSHEGMNRPDQRAMSHLLDAFSYPISYLFPVDRESFAIKPLRAG